MPKKHCMTGQFPWQNIKMLSEYVLQKSILPPEADCGSKSKNRRRVRQESMPERQETLRGIKSISCWDSIFFSLLKQRVDRIRHHHYTGLIYFSTLWNIQLFCRNTNRIADFTSDPSGMGTGAGIPRNMEYPYPGTKNPQFYQRPIHFLVPPKPKFRLGIFRMTRQ